MPAAGQKFIIKHGMEETWRELNRLENRIPAILRPLECPDNCVLHASVLWNLYQNTASAPVHIPRAPGGGWLARVLAVFSFSNAVFPAQP